LREKYEIDYNFSNALPKTQVNFQNANKFVDEILRKMYGYTLADESYVAISNLDISYSELFRKIL